MFSEISLTFFVQYIVLDVAGVGMTFHGLILLHTVNVRYLFA